MLYVPGQVAAADLDIAQAPYFGGEWAIYLATVAAVHIADIDLSAPTVGVLIDDPATTLPAAPTGANLVVVARTPVLSAANVVITLACMDNTGTPVAMNGVATFAPPARAANQSANFQRGYATDLVPAVVGKKFTAITSLTTIVGGDKNQEFSLYQLPELADYTFIGCTTDFKFNSKGRVAKGIDCGMESDKFIKRGKTQPGEASLDAKFKGFAESLARFDGQKTTLMAIGIKDGQVTTDRVVLTQFVPSVEINLPDGDGEAMQPAKGKFAEQLFFVAP
jgi:hypothetical protein